MQYRLIINNGYRKMGVFAKGLQGALAIAIWVDRLRGDSIFSPKIMVHSTFFIYFAVYIKYS